MKWRTIAIAALLATTAVPAMASGPTPADVAAFSAASASLPDTKEIKREQASGNLTNFISSARRVMDVVVTVAERDYPQLIADWKDCLQHTDVASPSYQTQCRGIGNQVNPILESEWNALSRASEARP